MGGVDHDIAVGSGGGQPPAPADLILRQLLEGVTHQHMIAACDHVPARRLPHHARPQPRIAEGFEQGLGRHAVIGALVQPQAALQPVEHRGAERKPLDALRRPVGRHLVARHAPHLLGIGLEEDRIELASELVDRPVLEAADRLVRKQLRPRIARHAQGRAHDPEVPQRLERAQRIGIEFALIIDAAHPRALDEVVGQYLVPQVDDLLAFREEAVPADVEAESLMLDRAADPADIDGVFLDHGDRKALPGQQIGGGQPHAAPPR